VCVANFPIDGLPWVDRDQFVETQQLGSATAYGDIQGRSQIDETIDAGTQAVAAVATPAWDLLPSATPSMLEVPEPVRRHAWSNQAPGPLSQSVLAAEAEPLPNWRVEQYVRQGMRPPPALLPSRVAELRTLGGRTPAVQYGRTRDGRQTRTEMRMPLASQPEFQEIPLGLTQIFDSQNRISRSRSPRMGAAAAVEVYAAAPQNLVLTEVGVVNVGASSTRVMEPTVFG
jgi:hypothetical protein